MIKKSLVMLLLLPLAATAASSIDLWYGGDFDNITWNDAMDVSPGAWVDISVYAKGEVADVNVADMMIPLGIQTQYIDQFDIEECRSYYPLSEWDVDQFVNLNDEYEEGWSSLSFLGFARLVSEESPWGHFETPTRILSFRVHVVENEQYLDQVIEGAIGPGYDTRQGLANAGDIEGNQGYVLNQHFASMHFVTTSIEDDVPIPDVFFLSDNFPNPFNPTTLMKYGLPEDAHVVFEVYDILGRKVETLVNEQQQAGYHQIYWNGDKVASGMYFFRMQAGDFNETKKMVMLK
ncbi:MAG: T9SS type A sorting domain-containing protein [candidate division Zixibacteria bacterium]|nr:T9SS type A sorting domain-containing protein [candidate division Zixibacteria bacterium]